MQNDGFVPSHLMMHSNEGPPSTIPLDMHSNERHERRVRVSEILTKLFPSTIPPSAIPLDMHSNERHADERRVRVSEILTKLFPSTIPPSAIPLDMQSNERHADERRVRVSEILAKLFPAAGIVGPGPPLSICADFCNLSSDQTGRQDRREFGPSLPAYRDHPSQYIDRCIISNRTDRNTGQTGVRFKSPGLSRPSQPICRPFYNFLAYRRETAQTGVWSSGRFHMTG
jgi:hypothetical protein